MSYRDYVEAYGLIALALVVAIVVLWISVGWP